MKNVFLFLMLFISVTTLKVNAQNLKNDCNFFKTSSFIYSSISLFQSVHDSDDRVTEKRKILPNLKNNIQKIESLYNELKPQYFSDTDFKEYELWVQGVSKSYEMLVNDDNTWMLGYSLIKMNLDDFLNQSY